VHAQSLHSEELLKLFYRRCGNPGTGLISQSLHTEELSKDTGCLVGDAVVLALILISHSLYSEQLQKDTGCLVGDAVILVMLILISRSRHSEELQKDTGCLVGVVAIPRHREDYHVSYKTHSVFQ